MGMLDQLHEQIADGLKNRTLTKCSRWANRRRIMGGNFPGPYSDKYHPWVREMHDSWAPFNWAMKGAQLVRVQGSTSHDNQLGIGQVQPDAVLQQVVLDALQAFPQLVGVLAPTAFPQ